MIIRKGLIGLVIFLVIFAAFGVFVWQMATEPMDVDVTDEYYSASYAGSSVKVEYEYIATIAMGGGYSYLDELYSGTSGPSYIVGTLERSDGTLYKVAVYKDNPSAVRITMMDGAEYLINGPNKELTQVLYEKIAANINVPGGGVVPIA